MEEIYTPSLYYKVLVRCFAYNQGKYIEDALNGFAIQKTNFPFVCLIVDDCSTDDEQNVIKAWMERECNMKEAKLKTIKASDIILVPHKSNESCTFAFYFLKQNLYKNAAKKMSLVSPWREHCEYEAICEGDDYWINDRKLQMQVDFLDSNIDYSLVYAYAKRYIQKNESFDKSLIGSPVKSFPHLLGENRITTLTTMARTQLLQEYENESKSWDKSKWLMGDYPLWLWMALKGKVYMLPDVVAVYRELENSASHFVDSTKQINFAKSIFDIQTFFSKYSGQNFSVYYWLKSRLYFTEIKIYLKEKTLGCLLIKSLLLPVYLCLGIYGYIVTSRSNE